MKVEETFKEAISRAVNYNMSLAVKQNEYNGFNISMEGIIKEAEVLFDNIYKKNNSYQVGHIG